MGRAFSPLFSPFAVLGLAPQAGLGVRLQRARGVVRGVAVIRIRRNPSESRARGAKRRSPSGMTTNTDNREALFEAGAEGDVFGEGGEDGFAAFAVGGGEEHAVGLQASHLAGGEIGDDDDAAAD